MKNPVRGGPTDGVLNLDHCGRRGRRLHATVKHDDGQRVAPKPRGRAAGQPLDDPVGDQRHGVDGQLARIGQVRSVLRRRAKQPR
jgi:hypothetical protein